MKQVLKLVKLFLVIFLITFTSCTNDLSEKNPEISFSFTLPQETISSRSTEENSDFSQWIINAQIETSEKVLQNITQEGTSGQTITIHFENIQVSQNVRIDIELTPKGEEKPSYKGTSEWFITKKGSNKIHITLKKIQYEIIPDDDNDTGTDDKPEIIIDAAVPQITTQPENVIEIVTENSGELISMPLSVTAQSTDNGTLSFVWQEKNVDNNIWENSTINSTDDKIKSSIKVDVYKGQYRTFKCIITNTNNSVNGNKTATIETNEVTVAYVQGQLTSIEAQYIGEYEKFNYEDFYTNGKVTVTETYTNGNTQNEVEVTADESRYTISPTKYDEKAIGYVPYTVQYNENQNISTKIRVPVKYELNANDFIIKSNTNDYENIGYSEDNPEKIPQFTGTTPVLTVGSKGETSSVPSLIYETENSDSATDYNIMKKLQSVWKKTINNQTTDFTDTNADNSIAGTYIYSNTLTVPTDDTWVIGESIQLDYYVQVYPWEIALKTSDGNTVDLTNLTGNTEYTLSATNDADTTSTVTWSSNNTSFTINNNKLTTPTATTTDQTATITAKVDNVTIGTITVIVKQLGSMANPFTNWNELCKYLSESETDLTTIYVQGSLDATETATVNRPVKIIPVGGVTITLYENLSEQLFTVNADLTLKGYNASNQFTIDGNLNEPEVPLIRTDNSNITLEYVTMQSYTNSSQDSSNPEGGAISFNCAGKTLSLINCNFTNVITNIAPNVDFDTPIGAICFRDGTLILDNCSFTNASPDYVDLYCYPQNNSTITLKGTINLPIIEYANTNSNGDLQITLEEDTFQSNEIKIYVDNISYGYDTDLFTLNNEQTLPNCFTLLNEGYEFDYTNGKIVEKTAGGTGGGGTQLSGTLVSTFDDLKNAVETGTASVIIIGNNIELTNYISITREVTIAANYDVTITQTTGANYLIWVKSEGNLTLGGGAGMLTLQGNSSATEELIYMKGNKLTLTENCKVTGVSNTTAKNAINIINGEFNMTGGEITGNTAGSAITTDSTQTGNITMNISGGKIYKNSGATNGGAINILKPSTTSLTTTVNIYGTAEIYNNTAKSNGGSIYTTGYHTININNSTEYDNKASIYDNYEGTNKQGASIYHNSNSTVKIMNSTLNASSAYTQNIINGVEQ